MTATVASFSTESGIAIGTGGDTFTLPTGISTGELLLVFAAKRNGLGLSTTSAYHEVDDVTGLGSTSQLALFARLATVDAADNFELTGGGSSNDDYAVVICRITGHGVTDVTDIRYAFNAQSASTAPDPPTLDALVSDDHLWLTALGFPPSGSGQSITAIPASFTNIANPESADDAGGIHLSVDQRAQTVQVQNPGTYTVSTSRQTVTVTVVIPPYQVADPKTVTDDDPVGITDSIVIAQGAQAVISPVGIPDNVAITAGAIQDEPADLVGIHDDVDTTLSTTIEYADIVDSAGVFGSGNTWPDALPTPTGVGRLALYFVVVDNPLSLGITGSAGWVERADVVAGAQVVEMALFARLLDGSANDTLSITIANSQDYVAWYLTISGHNVTNVNTEVFVSSASTGTLSIADPPNLDTGASRSYLWLTAAGIDTTSTDTITAVPSAFTTVITQRSSNQGGSCILTIAQRDLVAQALNPTTYNHPLQEWVAFTIAIPPGFVEFLPEPIDIIGITDTVVTVVAPYPQIFQTRTDTIGISDIVQLAIAERYRQPWPQAR